MNQKFEFTAPQIQQQIQSFSSLLQIKRFYASLHKQIFKFKVGSSQKYVYLKCRECNAHVRYKQNSEDSRYVLSTISNKHFHVFLRKNDHLKLFQHFIQNLPVGLSLNCQKKLAMRQLRLTSSQFYYLNSKLFQSKLTFKSIVEQLQADDYHMVFQPLDSSLSTLPQVSLFISPQMIENYRLYGQNSLSVDMTYNLIKKSISEEKPFKVGVFAGLSKSKKIVPYGLAIMREQSKQNYMKLLIGFRQIMKRQSNFIITDQCIALISALKELKRTNQISSIHLLDSFHILKNIKKRLKKKQNLSYFRNLMFAQNQKQFNQQLKYTYQRLQLEEIQVLEKFVQQSSLYCISQIQNKFLGFSISDSLNQKINDILKTSIPIQKNFTFVVKKALTILKSLSTKCNAIEIQRNPVETFYNWPQIKLIRLSLSKPVFKQFCSQLGKMLSCQISEYPDFYLIRQNKYEFKVKKHGDEVERCQCGYGLKSGIICHHQLKYCFYYNKKILSFIHEKWKFKEPFVCFGLGRGKNTRKNMLR